MSRRKSAPAGPSEAELKLAALKEQRALLELQREQSLFESERQAAQAEEIARARHRGVNFEALAVQTADRLVQQAEHDPALPAPKELHESLSFYDWFDQASYGAGTGWGASWGAGPGPILNPVSTRMDRRQGRMLPFLQTEQDLMVMRGIARIISTLNCPAQGIIGALVNYVIGEKGFTFKVGRKRDKMKVPDGLEEAVQDVIDGFADDCHWADLQAELFWRSRRDGEYFLALYESPGGKTKVRIFEPEQITQMGSERWTPAYIRSEHGQELTDKPDWYWGVLTPFNDVCEVHGYNAYWDMLGESEYLPASMLQHFKLSDRNVKRGISDFYAAFRMLQKSDNLATKIVSQAANQASIGGIRQHPAGRTQSEVTAFRTSQSDYMTQLLQPQGGTRTVYNKWRLDGDWIDVPFGQEYSFGPMGSPQGPVYIEVLQAALRWVAAKWNMPEWIVSGDASNNNMASSLVAESPFCKSVKFMQHRYGPRWVAVMWKVIEHACEWGRFDRFGEWGDFDTLRRFLEISVSYPEVETRDRAQETDRRLKLAEGGYISPVTLCAEEGYDYEHEKGLGAAPRPASITAKADGMDETGQVTALSSGEGKGGKPGQAEPVAADNRVEKEQEEGQQAPTAAKPEQAQDGGERRAAEADEGKPKETPESGGAVQPSAFADVSSWDLTGSGGLAGERRKKLAESAADTDLRQAIRDAAEATNTDPSDKQKEAGNYRKGKVKIHGLTIAIENPKGSTRTGTDEDGRDWSQRMAAHYGELSRSEGADGDAVDVFIGPDPEAEIAFVIDQVNRDGSFNEHKCLLGYLNEQAAREGYLANYEPGWKGLGAITPMTVPQFKAWLTGDTSRPVALAESAAPVARRTLWQKAQELLWGNGGEYP